MRSKRLSVREALSNLKRQAFVRIFLFLVIAVSIPSVCIGAFAMKYSFDHIIDQAKQSSGSYLEAKRETIEQRLETIDSLIAQFVSSGEIWKLITNRKSSDVLYYRLSDIKAMDIFNLHYNRVVANNMVHSMYVYEESCNYLYTESKYAKSEFSDGEILNTKFDSNCYLTSPRMIKNTKVFSYIRKFRVFANDDYLFVMINIKYDAFFSDVMGQEGNGSPSLILYGPDGSPLFSPRGFPAVPDLNDLLQSPGFGDEDSTILVNGTSYFALATEQDDYGMTLAYLQQYNQLVEPAGLLTKVLLLLSVTVLSLSLILAFLFSTNLYSPLSKLSQKISLYSADANIREKDDFKLIDSITRDLYASNRELSSRYELILPYFEKYSILDIMNSRHIDSERYKSILSLIGVHFAHEYFYIALVDSDRADPMDDVKSALRDSFAEFDEPFSYVLSAAEDNRIVLLVNSGQGSEHMAAMAEQACQRLRSAGLCVTFSISDACTRIDDIYEAYTATLRLHNRKCFFGGGVQSGGQAMDSRDGGKPDDGGMETALLNAVKAQNARSAMAVFSGMLDKHVKDGASIDFIKYWLFTVIGVVRKDLAGLGMSVAANGYSDQAVFARITGSGTLDDLNRLMRELINDCIKEVGEYKKEQHSAIIQKAISYIKSNYMRNIGLDDIAASVYLNTRYLCNLFKAETHFTMMEYLTKYRMEVALDLLGGRMRIKEIAVSVGYNNIQSFIRFFKNQYGMTPTDYRRNKMLDVEMQQS